VSGKGSAGKGVGCASLEGIWSGDHFEGDVDCSTGNAAAVPTPSVRALRPANMSSKSSLRVCARVGLEAATSLSGAFAGGSEVGKEASISDGDGDARVSSPD